MSKSIVAVDPGTINTGWVKMEGTEDSIVVHDWGLVPVEPSQIAVARVAEILNYLVGVIGEEPRTTELWVELFAPYGARRGMMWNASLVGALCYLPVTRQDKLLTSYGVYPV